MLLGISVSLQSVRCQKISKGKYIESESMEKKGGRAHWVNNDFAKLPPKKLSKSNHVTFSAIEKPRQRQLTRLSILKVDLLTQWRLPLPPLLGFQSRQLHAPYRCGLPNEWLLQQKIVCRSPALPIPFGIPNHHQLSEKNRPPE